MRLGASGGPVGPGHGIAAGRRVGAPAWSPASIAGKLLWLRPGVADTIVSSHVTAAADQSGAGNGITFAALSANQPIQSTCAAANGAASWYFDGNDDGTTATPIVPTTAGAGYTIFLVCAFDDVAARAVFATSALNGTRVSQSVSGTAKIEDWKAGAIFSTDGAARTTPLNLVYVEQVGPSPNSILYVNGSIVATSAASTTVLTPSGVVSIGSAAGTVYFKGHLLEAVMTNTRATTTEIAAWNARSLTRYGV